MSNDKSKGLSFFFDKMRCDQGGRDSYTNSIKLVKLSHSDFLEDIVSPIEGVIPSCICCDAENYVIYNYR